MELILYFIISTTITATAYLIVPLICLLIAHKTNRGYSPATINKIVIFNSIVVWLLFRVEDIISGEDFQSGASVILWSWVAYKILKKYALREEPEEANPEELESEKTETTNSFSSEAKKEKQRTSTVVVSILLALSIVLNVYQYCATPQLDNNSLNQKLEFFDEHVVFVEDDGTNLYHKYDCYRFVGDCYWAYNIENAIYIGYEPCPRCCN